MLEASEDKAFYAAEMKETNFCPELSFTNGCSGRSTFSYVGDAWPNLAFKDKEERLLQYIFGENYRTKMRRRR